MSKSDTSNRFEFFEKFSAMKASIIQRHTKWMIMNVTDWKKLHTIRYHATYIWILGKLVDIHLREIQYIDLLPVAYLYLTEHINIHRSFITFITFAHVHSQLVDFRCWKWTVGTNLSLLCQCVCLCASTNYTNIYNWVGPKRARKSPLTDQKKKLYV